MTRPSNEAFIAIDGWSPNDSACIDCGSAGNNPYISMLSTMPQRRGLQCRERLHNVRLCNIGIEKIVLTFEQYFSVALCACYDAASNGMIAGPEPVSATREPV